jgi:hypothetical protein
VPAGALPATATAGEWARAAAQEQNSRGADLVPIEPIKRAPSATPEITYTKELFRRGNNSREVSLEGLRLADCLLPLCWAGGSVAPRGAYNKAEPRPLPATGAPGDRISGGLGRVRPQGDK